MDEAVDMVEDRLDKYGDTLPLDGRAEKRPEDDPEVLTEKLTEVLKVAATGKGCVAIAEELGKHKSTVSRQLDQINDRLAVKNTEEAVQVAKERGLI